MAKPLVLTKIAELENGYSSLASIRSAAITTAWVGTVPPYTQVVSVPGIKSTDLPTIGVVYSSTFATKLLEQKAWSMINEYDTGDGTITFTCFYKKPTTALNITVKGA